MGPNEPKSKDSGKAEAEWDRRLDAAMAELEDDGLGVAAVPTGEMTSMLERMRRAAKTDAQRAIVAEFGDMQQGIAAARSGNAVAGWAPVSELPAPTLFPSCLDG